MVRHAWMRMLLGVLVVVAALGFALGGPDPSAAATLTSSDGTGIAVDGVGSVWVKPDVARISLGVSVNASNVATARARAAEAMTAVQNAVIAKGVAESDIQTQYISVYPQYGGGPQPTITGYQVSNSVQVTVRNIDAASEVLDAAVAAGGNAIRVNGLSFTVDQPDQYLSQARRQAVKDARARAEVLAAAAGVSVGRAKSIVEVGSTGTVPVAPRASAGGADMAAAPTPINPGEQRVQLTVSVVFEIR